MSVMETLLERPDISSFAQNYWKQLRQVYSCYLYHLAKERSFSKFQKNQLGFPSIWKEYVPIVPNLLSQSVNRCIFEKLLTSRFSVTPKVNPVTQSGLYAEEENVIRYVSGFIAHKLLQVYKKDHSPRAALYVECLTSMAVSGPESNFYDYDYTTMIYESASLALPSCSPTLFGVSADASVVFLLNCNTVFSLYCGSSFSAFLPLCFDIFTE